MAFRRTYANPPASRARRDAFAPMPAQPVSRRRFQSGTPVWVLHMTNGAPNYEPCTVTRWDELAGTYQVAPVDNPTHGLRHVGAWRVQLRQAGEVSPGVRAEAVQHLGPAGTGPQPF